MLVPGVWCICKEHNSKIYRNSYIPLSILCKWVLNVFPSLSCKGVAMVFINVVFFFLLLMEDS